MKLIESAAEYLQVFEISNKMDWFKSERNWSEKVDLKQAIGSAAEFVLRNFHIARPEIKFPEGSSMLAVMVATGFASETEAVSGFLNLMHQHFFLDFFSLNWGYMRTRLDFFEKLIKERLPLLESHFSLLRLHSNMFFLPWLLSGFALILPFKAAVRVWDGFLLLGESHMFAAAIAFLSMYEHRLMTQGLAGCIEALLGQSKETAFDEEKFFECLKNESVSADRLAAWLSTQVLAEEKQELFDLLLV